MKTNWPRKCARKFCRHTVCRHHHNTTCSRCRARDYAERYPLHRRYYQLKFRAKERGVPFHLSRDYFLEFCAAHGYEGRGGKKANSPSIDRIDAAKGYQPGNLQILTISLNSRKAWICCEKPAERYAA